MDAGEIQEQYTRYRSWRGIQVKLRVDSNVETKVKHQATKVLLSDSSTVKDTD